MRSPRNTGLAGSLGIFIILAAVPMGAEADERLKVAPRLAVPGQVVELRGPGVGTKAARVTISGRRAQVLERRGTGRVSAIVPVVGPGRAAVVVRAAGSRLVTGLRIAKGFSGSAKPKLDPKRAASAAIGPSGGSVTARGGDGTLYSLSIPRGALYAPTTITLTPLQGISGLPLPGRPVGVQFGPDGLALARPAT